MTIKPLIRACCLSVLSTLLLGSGAVDDVEAADIVELAEPSQAGSPDDWQIRITPYAWATSVVGDVTVRGRTVEVDASFIDIVEESDSFAALMGYVEARKGPLALYGDLIWGDFSFSRDTLRQRNPIADLSFSGSADAGLDYEMLMIETGAMYEAFRHEHVTGLNEDGTPAAFVTALDVLAGTRYWRQEADVTFAIEGDVDIPGLGLERRGDRALARSGTIDWFDPIVGMRVRHQMPGGHELQLRGDIGGFGFGSDFTWQAFGGYSYERPMNGYSLATVLGYRAMGFDFAEGGGRHRKGVDVILHGPVLGLSLRF